MSRARAGLTAAVLLSALAFGGCSGDAPEPKFAPPSSTAPTSPSTTAASGLVEPTLPAAAMGDDAAAAEAFVKHYWAMVNYAQATGDVNALRRLGRKCVNCDNGVQFIEGVYSQGGEIRGGDGTPKRFDVSFTKLQGDWWAVVDCVVGLTPQDVDVPGSAKDKHYKGGDRDIRMYLQPDNGSWIVRTMGLP